MRVRWRQLSGAVLAVAGAATACGKAEAPAAPAAAVTTQPERAPETAPPATSESAAPAANETRAELDRIFGEFSEPEDAQRSDSAQGLAGMSDEQAQKLNRLFSEQTE